MDGLPQGVGGVVEGGKEDGEVLGGRRVYCDDGIVIVVVLLRCCRVGILLDGPLDVGGKGETKMAPYGCLGYRLAWGLR